jgi:hypothetical protein
MIGYMVYGMICDMKWYMIWYDMILLWYKMIWYDRWLMDCTWGDGIPSAMVWYGMMIWNDIWYDI